MCKLVTNQLLTAAIEHLLFTHKFLGVAFHHFNLNHVLLIKVIIKHFA